MVALGILCVMSGQLATAKAETFPKNMADRLTSLKTYLVSMRTTRKLPAFLSPLMSVGTTIYNIF